MEISHISALVLFSGQQYRLPRQHMDKKAVMDVTEKKMIAKFLVGYMYFNSLKQHEKFR